MAGRPFGGAAPPFRPGGKPRDMSEAGKPSSSAGSGSSGGAKSGGFSPGKLTDSRRRVLAKSGHAMRDGSFPITDVKSLRDATHAIGRADAAKRPAVARHIVKHGRRLGAMQHVGDSIRSLAAGGK